MLTAMRHAVQDKAGKWADRLEDYRESLSTPKPPSSHPVTPVHHVATPVIQSSAGSSYQAPAPRKTIAMLLKSDDLFGILDAASALIPEAEAAMKTPNYVVARKLFETVGDLYKRATELTDANRSKGKLAAAKMYGEAWTAHCKAVGSAKSDTIGLRLLAKQKSVLTD